MKKTNKPEQITFLFIVPTLNSYKKLPKLIDSLTNQTYSFWRCLLVDGDSNEKHKKWVKSIVKKDQRFISINENKNERGIYPAMSKGYKSAFINDWIIFLGSDDWLSSRNVISSLVESISKNSFKKIDLLISSTDLVNPKTKKISRSHPIKSDIFIERERFLKLLFFGYMPNHQSLCFSYDLLGTLMPYSEDFDFASDNELILKLSLCKEFKRILFCTQKTINIEAGGISSKFILKRTLEVAKIYFRYYKFKFFIPFSLRYINKIRYKILNFKKI